MLGLSQGVAGRPNPQIRYRRTGVDGASFTHLTEEGGAEARPENDRALQPNLLGVRLDGHVPIKDGVTKNLGPKWEGQLK